MADRLSIIINSIDGSSWSTTGCAKGPVGAKTKPRPRLPNHELVRHGYEWLDCAAPSHVAPVVLKFPVLRRSRFEATAAPIQAVLARPLPRIEEQSRLARTPGAWNSLETR